ncbi:hypothetical protein RWH45_06550 [Microbacterium sp. KSW4-17]|uniref:DNA-binding protein n=1 Tax=Microbacterium galbum TaxID=3075994 RepID=A0ABU3T6A6_9MICO|nr:hypothetical protein [Microbacterium sp. KSW4-17]MDU0366869.1 hypothetical protein [Microbacterium sp. KSW4-17]
MHRRDTSRRFRDLTPDDAALVEWDGEGYPPALAPLITRLTSSGIRALNVNQGWWPLVKRLDEDIAALAPDYRVEQLGEDLGCLDIHLAPGDVTDETEYLIWGAQAESVRTCEICADRAWLYRQRDWLITLCVDDARARGARAARTDEDIVESLPRGAERGLAFATSAGMAASAFTVEARRKNDEYVHASTLADDTETASWLSSSAVARLMGVTPAKVNELRRRGELFAARRSSGRYSFPGWQLDQQNEPLRGLPEVLRALRGEDAVTVSRLLTAPSNALRGSSVVQWLASGRDPHLAAASIYDIDMT